MERPSTCSNASVRLAYVTKASNYRSADGLTHDSDDVMRRLGNGKSRGMGNSMEQKILFLLSSLSTKSGLVIFIFR